MEKKQYNVRDTIPETPDAFYDAVERSLAVCHTGKNCLRKVVRRQWVIVQGVVQICVIQININIS